MLINYHKNSFRSEQNEVILIKNCELFIGTNSGPHWIASSLGKKLCLINVPFNDGFPYYKDIIYLPLKYFKNNKIINIDHILKNILHSILTGFLITIKLKFLIIILKIFC